MKLSKIKIMITLIFTFVIIGVSSNTTKASTCINSVAGFTALQVVPTPGGIDSLIQKAIEVVIALITAIVAQIIQNVIKNVLNKNKGGI